MLWQAPISVLLPLVYSLSHSGSVNKPKQQRRDQTSKTTLCFDKRIKLCFCNSVSFYSLLSSKSLTNLQFSIMLNSLSAPSHDLNDSRRSVVHCTEIYRRKHFPLHPPHSLVHCAESWCREQNWMVLGEWGICSSEWIRSNHHEHTQHLCGEWRDLEMFPFMLPVIKKKKKKRQ